MHEATAELRKVVDEGGVTVVLADRQLRGTILVSSGGDRDGADVDGELALDRHEGVVVALAPAGLDVSG